jgi:hypothetical protein
MTKIIRYVGFRPHALTFALAIVSAAQANATNFTIGGLEGQFDTSLSVGSSWAMSEADRRFISTASGGKASGRTSDDGRLNFKKGETFSKIFKGSHDLSLKYGESGAFLRGKYWYDFELKDEHRQFYDIQDHNRKVGAQSSGAQILDAFVYHNYELGELPGSVRVGKQVVSWGESTFIGNSINSINPVDASAFRRPGAEIKEGLIPVNLIYLTQSLNESLSVEGFYQLEWDQTVVDNCGTFFSSTDLLADGCDDRVVVSGRDLAPGVSNNTGPATGNNFYIPRVGDRDAKDSGQFGLALRWYAAELNDTEFGAYAMNYHSRTPVFSTVRSSLANPAMVGYVGAAPLAGYRIEYPEDIRLYGLSFQTTVGGTALSGEVSYRPNMPLQVNPTDLAFGALGLPLSPVFQSGHASNTPGTDIDGYESHGVTQFQITAIKFIDQVMGASRMTLIGEAGYNHIEGINTDVGSLRFGRDSLFGTGQLSSPATCRALNAATPQECNDDGYYTSNSWGYRLRANLDYSNVIAGINLSPNITWSHDVAGYGPNFTEGAKAISLGVNADYKNTYTGSLSYTDFFGGDYNTLTDRDFLALSFGVNF